MKDKNKFKVGYNSHLTLNNLLVLIRTVAIIFAVVAFIEAFFFGIRSTQAVSAIESSEASVLAKDTKTISYIARVNNMFNEEVVDLVYELDNPLVLSCIYTIIPTFILLVAIVLICFGCLYLFKFTAGIKSQKTLFTKQKYFELRMIRIFVYVPFAIFTLMFGLVFLFIFITVVMFYEILLYLFDSMLEMQKKDSK